MGGAKAEADRGASARGKGRAEGPEEGPLEPKSRVKRSIVSDQECRMQYLAESPESSRAACL